MRAVTVTVLRHLARICVCLAIGVACTQPAIMVNANIGGGMWAGQEVEEEEDAQNICVDGGCHGNGGCPGRLCSNAGASCGSANDGGSCKCEQTARKCKCCKQ